MTKYKTCISIDEENFWIIADNMFRPTKVLWNPTEKELKDATLTNYSKTNICNVCIEENNITEKSILYPGNVGRNIDKYGKKIDDMICKTHSLRNYKRYDPNSLENLKKLMRDCRTGNLKYHNQILGYNCEELTKEWLGVKRLSVEHDKYSRLSLDHSPIPKGISIMIGRELVDLSGKIASTKGRLYDTIYGQWPFTDMDEEFDILICYCISGDGRQIERIYFFPKKETINITKISICKISKYNKYRVEDEKELKSVNNIWKNIISRNKEKCI